MPYSYAVVGNPIAHSKSPQIHSEFARQTGKNISYAALLCPLDAFATTLNEFRAQGGKGVNVTVPFKHEAWQYSSRRSERAECAHAVNTLCFRDGEVFGDNTDGAGLVRDIKVNLSYPIKDKCILLMGAGGASSGVLPALVAEQPKLITIANRNVGKAAELAKRFMAAANQVEAKPYSDLKEQSYDIVINATSSSLKNEMPPVPNTIFRKGALAYDMMYGKNTPFLQFARNNAATHLADGIGMLVEQAAESFFIWHGSWPKTAPVITLLKQAL